MTTRTGITTRSQSKKIEQSKINQSTKYKQKDPLPGFCEDSDLYERENSSDGFVDKQTHKPREASIPSEREQRSKKISSISSSRSGSRSESFFDKLNFPITHSPSKRKQSTNTTDATMISCVTDQHAEALSLLGLNIATYQVSIIKI